MPDNETRRDLSPVFWALKLTFGLVPVVAGLDKFTNLLVIWPKYIAPAFAQAIPFSPQGFMYLVGVIEIVAGLGVLLSPWTRAFAWIVAIWLWCISFDLIVGGFYDIAVRDLALSVGALCFARLTQIVPADIARRRSLTPAEAR